MDKKLKIVLISLFILILISGVTFWIIKKNKGTTEGEDNTVENTYEEEEDLFAKDKEVEHNLRLTIISPEEETFIPRQARMYNALAEGNGKYADLVKCNWKFYLDENNGEVLYKEQDTTSVLSGESREMCGFTSTFIDRAGKLRVVLTMTVYNAVDENLETVSAEREYIVQN